MICTRSIPWAYPRAKGIRPSCPLSCSARPLTHRRRTRAPADRCRLPSLSIWPRLTSHSRPYQSRASAASSLGPREKLPTEQMRLDNHSAAVAAVVPFATNCNFAISVSVSCCCSIFSELSRDGEMPNADRPTARWRYYSTHQRRRTPPERRQKKLLLSISSASWFRSYNTQRGNACRANLSTWYGKMAVCRTR